MVGMLEQVLLKVDSRNAPLAIPKKSSIGSLHSPPCAVCGARDHSTLVHCKSDRLCFGCLAPGHAKHQCPNRLAPNAGQVQGN